MKTLLITLVVFALLAGGVLAFSGSSNREDDGKTKTTGSVSSADSGRTNTGSGSDDSEVRGDDSRRTVNRSSSNSSDDDDDSDSVKKNRTANRSSSDDDSDDEDDNDENEGRNSTAKLARAMAKRLSEDMKDAANRCAQMGNRTEIANCLLQAANASLYADEPLRVVNESNLRCADAGTARERAACRISLKREEQEEGLYYMPEECRNLTGDERATCLSRYDAIQPCRFERGDDARFKCVRARIGLNASARDLVAECKLQVRGNASTNTSAGNGTLNNGTNASIDDDNERGIGGCVAAVRARVFEDAKFRIYNLEEKAERLARYGVSNETIAEFIVKLEELKAKFIAADGVEAKKAVLREAEEAWKEFLAKARAEAQGSQTPPTTGTNQTNSSQNDTNQSGTNQSGETP